MVLLKIIAAARMTLYYSILSGLSTNEMTDQRQCETIFQSNLCWLSVVLEGTLITTVIFLGKSIKSYLEGKISRNSLKF